MALPDRNSEPEIQWRFNGQVKNIADYMNEVQLTGLLILKNGEVVAERYQYGRQPGMPMRSFSMAKTITALLVGMAHQKGFISSLDDPVSKYWPEIAESAYGQTSVRALLRMSSGVPYKELYTWTPDDDNAAWGTLLYHPANRGRKDLLERFLKQRTQREVNAGERFHYASIETDILGRVLVRATGRSGAELTQEWIWQPMGAEHPAYWNTAAIDGAEAFAGGFNASLRDYGRLGVLLANDGKANGQEILAQDFLLEATDPLKHPPAFRPGQATPYMGYGYQVWITPYRSRTFALQGIHGQTILVQPESKIVMVQTAVFQKASGIQDAMPYRMRGAFFDGVLRSLGGITP